jgi:hypothetical protein
MEMKREGEEKKGGGVSEWVRVEETRGAPGGGGGSTRHVMRKSTADRGEV